MQLHELQALCADSFTGSTQPAAAAQLLEQIEGGPITKSARIAAYRNNQAGIRADTLRKVFGTIERLVGEPCFRALARRYAQEHASNSGDLQSFGAAFPALLELIYGATEHAFLTDVARLEFALDECLTAEHVPGLTSESLQAALSCHERDIALTGNPSLHVIDSRYPILEIWRAHASDDLQALSLNGQGQNVAVVRAGCDAQLTLIGETGLQLIRALSGGSLLLEALEDLGEVSSEQLSQALHDVLRSNAFTAVEVLQ